MQVTLTAFLVIVTRNLRIESLDKKCRAGSQASSGKLSEQKLT